MSERSKTTKELLVEFEELVDWFDGDEVDVETAIVKFEQGNKLAEQIKKQLAEAKNEVEVVKKNFKQ